MGGHGSKTQRRRMGFDVRHAVMGRVPVLASALALTPLTITARDTGRYAVEIRGVDRALFDAYVAYFVSTYAAFLVPNTHRDAVAVDPVDGGHIKVVVLNDRDIYESLFAD
jgi:hypothetical protein